MPRWIIFTLDSLVNFLSLNFAYLVKYHLDICRINYWEFSRNELIALHLYLEIEETNTETSFQAFIGNVRDEKRMQHLFETYKPHYVYHAAVCRHVPMMEDNGAETTKASTMIRLTGSTPNHSIQSEYTSIQWSEKLFDKLLNDNEGSTPAHHEKNVIAQVREYLFNNVEKRIHDLINYAKSYDNQQVVKSMKQIVQEFKSKNPIFEKLYHT